MTLKRIAGIAALALTLAGCSTVDTVSRNAPLNAPGLETAIPEVAIVRSYDVRDIRVAFPSNLTVSESNGYYPIADIVWRGDPLGDRRQQIGEIFTASFRDGTSDLHGDIPVVATIRVLRFHSLTERTRYTVGGVHSIKFELAVHHAQTGAVVESPRIIIADLPALGGQAAVMAETRGEGQKVRIMTHLAQVAQQELGPQNTPILASAPAR